MSTKTNLKDVTFLIPIKIDSIVRLENLLMVTDFISTHFDTHIYILEAAGYNNKILDRLLPQGTSVTFVKDYDPIFHRTKYINLLVKNCPTPYLAVWDADVIVPPEQIIQSVECLRNNESAFVFPYENDFLETTTIVRELYQKTRNLDVLRKNTGKMSERFVINPVGGAFFASKETYIKCGIENEYFYGWGSEDNERLSRWETLGYRCKYISGPLFHLTHERGMNSKFHSSEQKNIKLSELNRIYAMSKNELEAEVKTWKR